jgi:carbon-monoxide dehydrogenase large subunit
MATTTITTTVTKTETLVGKRIRRKEDPRLITGTATYVDDIKLPGMHHACILRSPHAAARIKSIDAKAALALPGVVAVFTGADIGGVGPVPCGASLPGLRIPPHSILATDRVYFVGHPVAVAVATDRYIAADAVDAIEVEYEPTQAIADPEKALAPGAPAVHPEWPDNTAFTFHQEGGEPEKAFAEAEVVVKQRITSQRLIPTAMETRGVVAEPHGAEKSLILYTSTQIPHLVRTLVAHAGPLRKPPARDHARSRRRLRQQAQRLRRRGADGLRRHAHQQARQVDRIAAREFPVHHSRPRPRRLLRDRRQARWHRAGPAPQAHPGSRRVHQLLTPAIPTLSVLMMPGLYKFRNISADIVGVFTNCVPTDAYRGAGRPEATHGIERMMDLLAVELKMDPSELRLINFIGNDEFPYATATGLSYDSGNYAEPLKKALDMVEYHKLRDQQAKAKAEGRLMGIGISTYGEICAFGPSPATPAGGWESATVKIEPSGTVTVMTGISPHGQGEETTFAQIAADELGVPLDDVMVLHGDTSHRAIRHRHFRQPRYGRRRTALYYALQDLKKKIVKFGQMLLDSEDVTFANGQCTDNRSGKSVGLAEVAGATYRAMKLPPNTEPGLVATHFWEPPNFAFPFGAHIVVTEVDRDTGQIKILRYVAVDDCGNIINPLLVDGQVHGGVVQGLGQALYEQAVYDENGQLITGELMDYCVPKASMIPWIESAHTVTPSPVNPLGVKGVGEAGTIGASPAIVNSVVDALSHLGVRHIDMPLTPEKIWTLLQDKTTSHQPPTTSHAVGEAGGQL